MIFRNQKFYLFALFLIIVSTGGFSQYKIKTRQVKLTVQPFQESTGFVSKQLLVINGVLKPIDQSDALMELRFYYEDLTRIKTYVIKCTKDSVCMDRYTVIFYGKGHMPPVDTSIYKPLAITNMELAGLYKKESMRRLPDQDWQTFLDSVVVKNHLFELPDQLALDSTTSALNIEIEEPRKFRFIKYELNVKGHFRAFEQIKALGYFDGDAFPALLYYKRINNLFNKLIAFNER